jgi:hypothetical protein
LGFRQNSAKAAEEGKSACGKSLIPNSAHKFEGFLVVGSKNGDTLSLFEPKSEVHAGREELLEQERGSDPDVRLWESCVEASGGGTRLTLHAACRGFEFAWAWGPPIDIKMDVFFYSILERHWNSRTN